jgi:hypothetical protein
MAVESLASYSEGSVISSWPRDRLSFCSLYNDGLKIWGLYIGGGESPYEVVVAVPLSDKAFVG